MKFESFINLVAVAIIAAHLGKECQKKKENQQPAPITYHRPGRVSYSKYIPNKINDFVFDTLEEAQTVFEQAQNVSGFYGTMTIADLYDLVGIESKYTDNKYGWTKAEIDRGRIQRTSHSSYELRFPAPHPLN